MYDVEQGVHKNGETVAVKVLNSMPGLDDEKFEKEFRNLTSLHHKNIVRLVGFCHETQREFILHNAKMIFADATRMALCFEYMHNGSLEKFLFGIFLLLFSCIFLTLEVPIFKFAF
jgi:serine/threonine protein kinase